MGVPGIEAQIASMGRVWPRFEVVARDSNAAVWLGPLRPLFMTYAVRVVYRAPLAIEMPNLRRMQPIVSIVTPPLRPRRGDPEGQLPHVYMSATPRWMLPCACSTPNPTSGRHPCLWQKQPFLGPWIGLPPTKGGARPDNGPGEASIWNVPI